MIFLGTYTRDTASKGIYATQLNSDTGELSPPILVAEGVDPAWVTLTSDNRFLYAIHPSTAQAIGFKVDRETPRLTPLPAEIPAPANPPSHLAVDATGRVLLAANYRDGFVASIPIRDDGSLGPPNTIKHEGRSAHPTRQDKPHVHSVTVSPDNRFVIVADLGVDRVYAYALDSASAKLTPASEPFVTLTPGDGPRHFKFGRDGRQGYVINELSNTVTMFDYDCERGRLTPRQSLTTLPADFEGENTGAEVRVHPSGRFLYTSNRGHDSLAVFSIAPAGGTLASIEIVKSGGRNPRNFALSPDGKWLVCAHQDTPLLTVFSVDSMTGRLTRAPHSAAVASCVCVEFSE
jgi:6-phosphogluconolactonase